MGYGRAETPCTSFKNWPKNPGLCGICAWSESAHDNTPNCFPLNSGPQRFRIIDDVPPPVLDPAVEAELKALGVETGDVDKILNYIANRIVSNEHLLAWLLTILVDKRKNAFDAIAPKLKFKPRPYTMLMHNKNKVARRMRQRLGFIPKG